MKKNFPFICFVLAFCSANAQSSLLFKLKFLPDRKYESAISMNMDMVMNISGDSASMQKIKERGVQLPMKMASQTTMNVGISTGSIKSENTFPMTMTYNNVNSSTTMNGSPIPAQPSPLNGQSIICTYSTEGKIQVDSIPGTALSGDMKETLTKTVTELVNQMHFPDSAMKVGDKFTQELPFNVPVPGLGMQMKIKVIYTLTGIENNIANFDLDESLNMDATAQQGDKTLKMTGLGTGGGKMTYIINEHIIGTMNTDFKINYKMVIGPLTMQGDANIIATHNTKILSAGK